MKKLLVLILVSLLTNEISAQIVEKRREVILGYTTLYIKDVEKIEGEIRNHSMISIKEVCYNHNVIVFTGDPSILDFEKKVFGILSNIKTSSSPILKQGSSKGLICDSQIPAILIDIDKKQ